MGVFGGKIERLLAIGGDGTIASKEDDSKSNRFKPVVKYFGPFTLDGGSNEHKFTMPLYIGSVKTMLVAGYEGAYGKTEKATPVRKPLMVLATLPRVLGPEENVKLPPKKKAAVAEMETPVDLAAALKKNKSPLVSLLDQIELGKSPVKNRAKKS